MEQALVWVDIETLGLDPLKDDIIEIALVVTDSDLNIITYGPDIVIAPTRLDESKLDSVVREMHESSGLLDEAKSKSAASLGEAHGTCWQFLLDLDVEPKSVPMAGSSVHFDRSFLKAQMPLVEDWFHYRNADVSSLREFMRRFDPESIPSEPQKSDAHRAKTDVEDSIALARYYKRVRAGQN